MDKVLEKLMEHQSETPSIWREEAEFRRSNRSWLRRSQTIAIKILSQMRERGLSQAELAYKMGCTQQYVSKILRGRENLSLETISKIEGALNITLMSV